MRTAFIAQLAHESGDLHYFEELSSGKQYEGRKDLGNTQPGDGVKYKGRGPIQITGRTNYAAAGKALGLDLINNPQLAADPAVGFKIAVWFWNSHKLSKYGDCTQASFDKTTKVINGGTNGQDDRRKKFSVALSVLKCNGNTNGGNTGGSSNKGGSDNKNGGSTGGDSNKGGNDNSNGNHEDNNGGSDNNDDNNDDDNNDDDNDDNNDDDNNDDDNNDDDNNDDDNNDDDNDDNDDDDNDDNDDDDSNDDDSGSSWWPFRALLRGL